MNNCVLEICDLKKSFNKKRILHNVSMKVNKGQVFYLLGPNGSGKTTTINCVLSLLKPDNGSIFLNGKPNTSTEKKNCGIVLEDDGFFRDMSVEKNMKVMCLIKGVSFDQISPILEKVSLLKHASKKVKKLSQGMRKRLAIAASLIGDPDFLIWDEPYNSLDPPGFKFLRNLILELKESGKTLLISTHVLDEVQKSGSNVALIDKGVIKDALTLNDLYQKYGSIDKFFFKLVAEV